MKYYTPLTALLLLLANTACSDADTLGDEPPREIVISGSPTWDNGIRELMDLKCAYCHAVPKPDTAPDDIIADLDLTVYDTSIVNGRVIRGADSVGRWIADGIFDHGLDIYVDLTVIPETILVARQMPLDYGTQLTDAEKGFLAAWSTNGSPRNDSPQPDGDPVTGKQLYDAHCGACHGFNDNAGAGVNAFVDGQLDPNRWYGPPVRPNTATVEKIKSMWLHKVVPFEFRELEALSTQEAADIRAYLVSVLFGD
ncbi:MAG: cytochrome c [Acidobacteriota bacterium]|nr:cytochrome c [Acidobacteriota bacterium]